MSSMTLALLTGIFFALALPPFNQEWLGWLALAPLLYAAQNRRPLESVGLGLLAGALCGVIHVGWHHNADALRLAYLPFLWLALFFGIVALAGQTARARTWTGLRWAGYVACVGVAVEWLTIFTPLPLNIALCQYQNIPLIQLASLTGIWGVSFLLWLVNAALADALLSRKINLRATLVTTMLVLVTLIGGWKQQRALTHGRPLTRVAAIQDYSPGETAGILPETKDMADMADRDAMTRQAAARGAKLAVWSEEALGGAFLPNEPQNPTNVLARQTHAYLVVGYSDDFTPHPHNCAALVAPNGRTLGVYHKTHLFMGERQVVTGGSATPAYASPLGTVGMEICFDSLYTDVTRGLARHGAQLIAMPNFDPPTPRGVLHDLHAAMLPFRAVENHVPFVRADSNGRSQIIDAAGRIVGQSPLWQADVQIGDIAFGDGRGTFFTRWGDWLPYLCAMLTAGIALRSARRPPSESPL